MKLSQLSQNDRNAMMTPLTLSNDNHMNKETTTDEAWEAEMRHLQDLIVDLDLPYIDQCHRRPGRRVFRSIAGRRIKQFRNHLTRGRGGYRVGSTRCQGFRGAWTDRKEREVIRDRDRRDELAREIADLPPSMVQDYEFAIHFGFVEDCEPAFKFYVQAAPIHHRGQRQSGSPLRTMTMPLPDGDDMDGQFETDDKLTVAYRGGEVACVSVGPGKRRPASTSKPQRRRRSGSRRSIGSRCFQRLL